MEEADKRAEKLELEAAALQAKLETSKNEYAKRMAAMLTEPEQEEETEEPAPSPKSSPKHTAILQEPESGRHDALEDEEAPQPEQEEQGEVERTAAENESGEESE